MSNVLVYTCHMGYGDLLYHFPLIKMLKKTYGLVDVWTFNPEPFLHNKDIYKLYRIVRETDPEPREYYGDNIIYLAPSRNPVANHLYQAANHMIDYITNSALGLTLRAHEKGIDFRWPKSVDQSVDSICLKYGLNRPFIVVNPAVGWPSRTLPLEVYQELIEYLVKDGQTVVLVGKDVNPDKFLPEDNTVEDLIGKETKTLYDVKNFPGTIDLTNKLSFHECCALYSRATIAINTENGNMVMSTTSNYPWNIYIPSLTAPEFRLPWRNGSQYHRTKVVGNQDDYYPASDYSNLKREAVNFRTIEVQWPSIDSIIGQYIRIASLLNI